MQVRRMSGALGAEVSGIDLTHELSPETAGALRDLLNQHEVLFFSGPAS